MAKCFSGYGNHLLPLVSSYFHDAYRHFKGKNDTTKVRLDLDGAIVVCNGQTINVLTRLAIMVRGSPSGYTGFCDFKLFSDGGHCFRVDEHRKR